MIQLTTTDGRLAIPRASILNPTLRDIFHEDEDPILLGNSPGGEPFTVGWPAPNLTDLGLALYDARESGYLPAHSTAVLLPDGAAFEIPN